MYGALNLVLMFKTNRFYVSVLSRMILNDIERVIFTTIWNHHV
jgi:hypothetical protein